MLKAFKFCDEDPIPTRLVGEILDIIIKPLTNIIYPSMETEILSHPSKGHVATSLKKPSTPHPPKTI